MYKWICSPILWVVFLFCWWFPLLYKIFLVWCSPICLFFLLFPLPGKMYPITTQLWAMPSFYNISYSLLICFHILNGGIYINFIPKIFFYFSAKSPLILALTAWGLALHLCELHSYCSPLGPSAPATLVFLTFLYSSQLTSDVFLVMLSMLGLLFPKIWMPCFLIFSRSLFKCHITGDAFPDHPCQIVTPTVHSHVPVPCFSMPHNTPRHITCVLFAYHLPPHPVMCASSRQGSLSVLFTVNFQCLELSLAHSRHSVNTCCINEWMN